MTESSSALNESLKAGNPEAWSEAMSLFCDRLSRAAWILCGDFNTAQDLVQETFAEAMSSVSRFEGRSDPYTWLHGILRHRYLLLRRKKRRFLRWLSLFGRRETIESTHAAGRDPVIGGETRIGIIEAVWRLSLKHREVVLLRYIEEKKVFEIAAFLSISEGTVKSRLHYALRRLRENLGAESATVTRPAENIDEM